MITIPKNELKVNERELLFVLSSDRDVDQHRCSPTLFRLLLAPLFCNFFRTIVPMSEDAVPAHA